MDKTAALFGSRVQFHQDYCVPLDATILQIYVISVGDDATVMSYGWNNLSPTVRMLILGAGENIDRSRSNCVSDLNAVCCFGVSELKRRGKIESDGMPFAHQIAEHLLLLSTYHCIKNALVMLEWFRRITDGCDFCILTPPIREKRVQRRVGKIQYPLPGSDVFKGS